MLKRQVGGGGEGVAVVVAVAVVGARKGLEDARNYRLIISGDWAQNIINSTFSDQSRRGGDRQMTRTEESSISFIVS